MFKRQFHLQVINDRLHPHEIQQRKASYFHEVIEDEANLNENL